MMTALFISASGQTPPKTPQDVLPGIPPKPTRADAPARLRCAAGAIVISGCDPAFGITRRDK